SFAGSAEWKKDFTISPAALFLNGIFYIVPGDSGAETHQGLDAGSSLYIYTRDRVCRNNENPLLQHIVVPVRDRQGEKIRDLNLYHFYDHSTGESGFMALDIDKNDFYELLGTRSKGVAHGSAWDPNVAVSPDGKFMAAVRKSAGSGISGDRLFLIKLEKEDRWDAGGHARQIDVGSKNKEAGGVSRIFAQSMTFGGAPDPHLLFFVTDRVHAVHGMSAPSEHAAASLWSVHVPAENSVAKYHDFIQSPDWPRAGDGASPFVYFGHPEGEGPDAASAGQLSWLRSEDNKTIFLRAGWSSHAGALLEPGEEIEEWCWDVLALSDMYCTKAEGTYAIRNVTEFPPGWKGKGFHIRPFGRAYNGAAKAAVSPVDGNGRRFIAFAAGHREGIERLYVASDDGAGRGELKPVTSPALFCGSFAEDDTNVGPGVYDPFFMRPGLLLFFYGKKPETAGRVDGPQTDLFSYQLSSGECLNLTRTARSRDPAAHETCPSAPPFKSYGNVRPCGCFPSRDRRFLFFLRGFNGDSPATSKVNLIGVDGINNSSLLDLSGNEFGRGFPPDLSWGPQAAQILGPDPGSMNMIIVPAETGDRLFFTAAFHTVQMNSADQVFMLSLKYPKSALPITSFPDNGPGYVDHLVPDPWGNYIAFTRSDCVPSAGTGFDEKIYVADLSRGHAIKEMTGGHTLLPSAAIYGSMGFASTRSSTQFIYGIGESGPATLPGNPVKARIWLYPLGDQAPPHEAGYPVTEEGGFLVFNILPVFE
ncbi:MAG: hypothetical protein ABIK28_04020, partial [Planctomycetota bacterium]